MTYKSLISTILLGLFFFSGCAVNRGVIKLDTPVSENSIQIANGKEIYIRSVTDARVFEVNPATPDIPSLDPDRLQTDDIKARAIGRKRNGFGKALGDILLHEDQSITQAVKDASQQAFREMGYKIVTSKKDISDKTYIVDIEVNKFWSWMNPGFWAITLSTEISTNITLKMPNGSQDKLIYVKAADTFQTGGGSNWIEVMHLGLKLYIDEIKIKYTDMK